MGAVLMNVINLTYVNLYLKNLSIFQEHIPISRTYPYLMNVSISQECVHDSRYSKKILITIVSDRGKIKFPECMGGRERLDTSCMDVGLEIGSIFLEAGYDCYNHNIDPFLPPGDGSPMMAL